MRVSAGAFTDEILLSPVKGNNKLWRNHATFAWHVDKENSDLHVIVPAGFVYDLASVPMLARPFVPHTTAPQASALHDFGYRFNVAWVVKYWQGSTAVYHDEPVEFDRKFWDDEFYNSMIALNVNPIVAEASHAGVRVGGWMAWNKHRRVNNREHGIS